MKYLSVCSGIEAATCAWHHMGWEPVAFSEIESFPSAVLKHHYPSVPNWGDMTKFKEWPDADVDVLVGGTPCQSFSVAGLRKGLDDPRGNLMLTYLAIAAKYRPKWVVWENVPGVLSSGGGNDFASLLRGLGELRYGFAYRILDAQYFGVPQRRRRVFVVGCFGDWRRAAAVLFERQSMYRNNPPERKKRQAVAGTLKGGTGSRGYPDPSDGNGGGLIRCADVTTVDAQNKCDRGDSQHLDRLVVNWPANIAPTLNAHFGDKQGLENQRALTGGGCSLPELSLCLNAGGMGRQDPESETLIPTIGGGFDVAHSLRGEGFDASEDGTGRGTPLVPVAYSMITANTGANGLGLGLGLEVAATLDRAQGQAVAFTNRGIETGGQAETLRAGSHGALPMVAFAQNQRDEVRTMEVAGALAGEPGMKQQTFVAQAFEPGSIARHAGPAGEHETVSTLRADMGDNQPAVRLGMQVRRLTPVECERLQGFPSIREQVKIVVCLDHQNGYADVVLLCRRWPSNASPAAGQEWTLPVNAAAKDLLISLAAHDPLAALNVRTNSVDELLEIRSHGKLMWSASNAGKLNTFHLPTLPASIAANLAPPLRCLALEARNGKAASLQNIRLSLQVKSGEASALKSGGGNEASASGAMSDAPQERFTTSTLGSTAPTCDSPIATSLCSVLAVISGCIPSETLPETFSLEFDLETPYTLITVRGKPAADGPRYKALGNSMAVPVMRFIGERIAAVDAIEPKP